MESFNTAFTVGAVSLTWNAIMLVLGILVAVIVSEILVKKRGLYKDLALDACIVGIPAGLVGARLFSALSGKIPFSAFFNLAVGGLNLPGALLFAGVGIAIYTRIKKLPLGKAFDALIPGAMFGLAVGRWADFFLCEGLGPIAGDAVPKFFPLCTFTAEYFRDGQTVAFAVFFLDFLVCLALGVAALLLNKKLSDGKTARVTILVYLFAEFILEWLRDGSTRQIVFGEVRFNQIAVLGMLLFFIGLSLALAKREAAPDGKPIDAPDEPETPEEPEEPEESDEPDEPDEPEEPEEPEKPDEPDEPEQPEEPEKEQGEA